MTDLNQFLQKNKEKIHELLNNMWQTIEKMAFQFEDKIPEIDLDNTHGNFVTINDGWGEAYYPNPSITFPFGEIGYSLDGLYCVYAVFVENLNEKHLEYFLTIPHENDDIKMELYGGDDCFSTFYSSDDSDDLDEIMKSIKDSSEGVIQIELSIEAFPEEELKGKLLEQILALYEFLSKNELLARFPIYDKKEEESD
ncbi:MAG: DUF3201 domain-containing protein [Asgard group archaeon]|nr:DUF3201 domain-containing protein [Asgard group archaeon]